MTTTDDRQLAIDQGPQTQPPDPAALRLPFDQYGRYRMAQEALDAARPILGERFRILDVGGFFRTGRGVALLPIRQFLTSDDVTVIDQQPGDVPGYIQGDGRSLDFADATFDFVVSCDTLEHVPAPDRPTFWRELLRVARHGVILAAPFASPEVVAAEDLLARYIRVELHTEQMQLKEHREYGLPDLPATRAFLDESGLRYHIYPSGYIHAWLAMMIAKHYLLGQTDDHDLHERLDAYYTRFLSADERREPAYRHMFVVAKDGHDDWLVAVDAVLAPTIRTSAPAGPGWAELANWLIQFVSMSLGDRHTESLTQTIAAQQQAIQALQQALAWREAQLHDLEQRCRWLEEQAQSTRRALAAVENGRVLRLLRWIESLRKPRA